MQNSIKKFRNSDSKAIIEKIVKILKTIMRKIPHKFLQFIKPLFECVLEEYKKFPISTFLYLFEIAITVYYECEIVLPYLQELYNQFYDITFYYLSLTSNPFEEYEYLIYDFLGVNLRVMLYNSIIIRDIDKLYKIVEFCLNCLVSNIPSLLSSACLVFESIFMVYWKDYSRKKYQDL